MIINMHSLSSHPATSTMDTGVKWLGCGIYHSFPSSIKVKNEQSYTPTPPLYFLQYVMG